MTQPDPVPTGGPAVVDFVQRDLRARMHKGMDTYGTFLQANNGRDALWDLYEELLDACCYLRQMILEREVH